jgi:hypothetical protein
MGPLLFRLIVVAQLFYVLLFSTPLPLRSKNTDNKIYLVAMTGGGSGTLIMCHDEALKFNKTAPEKELVFS